MSLLGSTFDTWRASLEAVHGWFVRMRAETRGFLVKAFGVFVAINLACFWWAVLTAYPEKLAGPEALEHFLISFPVAFLGAVFDVASLGVTLWAIDRALKARLHATYVAFLGVDLVIAAAATFWVLFAFVVSGWLVGHIIPVGETLADRAELYQDRVARALDYPFARESIKNVYFGMVMGASAMIPTLLHVLFALWAFLRAANRLVFSSR